MPNRSSGPINRFTEMLEGHFAWKVRQRKRWDRNPLLVTFQDKVAAKLYARARGVESAALLWITDDAATLPFDRLPPDYFIKATHGQSWNIRCAASRLFDYRNGADFAAGLPDAALTEEACVALCQAWLGRFYSSSEWAYRRIKPRLIVERPLNPREGEELLDYRFYTFDGKVRAISLGSPHYRKDKQNVFLTPEWEVVSLTRYAEALPVVIPPKPDTLSAMIAAAEALGEGSDFVRIDLYDTDEGIRLGELTVYPQGGRVGTPSGCPRFNRWLGAQWVRHPQRHTFASTEAVRLARKAGASPS